MCFVNTYQQRQLATYPSNFTTRKVPGVSQPSPPVAFSSKEEKVDDLSSMLRETLAFEPLTWQLAIEKIHIPPGKVGGSLSHLQKRSLSHPQTHEIQIIGVPLAATTTWKGSMVPIATPMYRLALSWPRKANSPPNLGVALRHRRTHQTVCG